MSFCVHTILIFLLALHHFGPYRPLRSLFHPAIIISTLGQALIHIACMTLAVKWATEAMGKCPKCFSFSFFCVCALCGTLTLTTTTTFVVCSRVCEKSFSVFFSYLLLVIYAIAYRSRGAEGSDRILQEGQSQRGKYSRFLLLFLVLASLKMFVSC